MLSDEEKKAIDDLKEISHYCSLKAIDIEEKYSDLWAKYVVFIQKVFNLIEKLSKEIEELKQEKEYLNCIIESDKDNYINKNEIKATIEDILNSENGEAIEKLIEWQSLLEKE